MLKSLRDFPCKPSWGCCSSPPLSMQKSTASSLSRDPISFSRIDDSYGAYFLEEGAIATGDPADTLFSGQGHGTHVAGTIASPINGIGIAGIAPNVKIMGIRVFMDDNGTATASDADILRALNYVLEMKSQGVNIRAINLSLGTHPGEEEHNPAMEQGLQKVAQAGILIVMAAGNASTNISLPGNAVYPANYNVPNTIVVGACSASSHSLAYFSNYGPTVDILAPGVNIYGPVPEFAELPFLFLLPLQPWGMTREMEMGKGKGRTREKEKMAIEAEFVIII